MWGFNNDLFNMDKVKWKRNQLIVPPQLTSFKDKPIVIMPLTTVVPANSYNLYVRADLA